jgi:hypothetical protein
VKKSQAVQLTLVASVAASTLAACAREEAQRCVNQQTNEVVADSLCGPVAQERARASGVPIWPFLWYMGGGLRGGGPGGIGARVAGGSFVTPGSPAELRANSRVAGARARGGFGSTARGRSGLS